MSLTLQQPVYSNPSGDQENIQVTIGPHTEWIKMSQVRQIIAGKVQDPNMIIYQALLLLRAGGWNFANGTLAQAASILNTANPIWWI